MYTQSSVHECALETCCLFTVACCLCQGADQVDLVPHGADIEVNASNVHDYVRKYAEHRMLHACQKSLEVLHGVHS